MKRATPGEVGVGRRGLQSCRRPSADPLPSLGPPLPARPCSADRTHRELRSLPEGGRRHSADREAREEARRTPSPAGTPPTANFQTLGAAEPGGTHLAHSHFRKRSRKLGGLIALW